MTHHAAENLPDQRGSALRTRSAQAHTLKTAIRMHAALQRISVDYQTGTTGEFFHTDITVKNTRCRGMLDQLSACRERSGCRFGDGRPRFGAKTALLRVAAT